MGALAGFVVERAKSLVSKKVGAALMAEGAVVGTDLQGIPLIVFIVVQGALDGWKYYCDKQSA